MRINFIVPMNIATPKLIQWKTAEMSGNKPFRGFGGNEIVYEHPPCSGIYEGAYLFRQNNLKSIS